MKPRQYILLSFIFPAIALSIVTSCADTKHIPSPVNPPPSTTATPTSLWTGLLFEKPIPHTTPLPPEEWTSIDGTYTKIDPSEPQWWSCRRCANYRPAGGIWKLQFNKGVMRIYYDVTGWRSIASYAIVENRLYIFNDPYCLEEVGEYLWELDDKWGLKDRLLTLRVVKDSCSINLRGENLSKMPWDSCQPPNLMTGASDHWRKSPGCETSLTPPAPPVPSTLNASVTIHPGYVREFSKEPNIYVHANNDEISPPEGFLLAHSEDSISYGLNRVLWGTGSFVEISTGLPISAMGVQIYGDHTIGWARVLFDGQEIWRGDTAAIWAHQGRNGGYIEVSDFKPGLHTLRVENMGFDYRPVTVAFFGFSYEGGVEADE